MQHQFDVRTKVKIIVGSTGMSVWCLSDVCLMSSHWCINLTFESWGHIDVPLPWCQIDVNLTRQRGIKCSNISLTSNSVRRGTCRRERLISYQIAGRNHAAEGITGTECRPFSHGSPSVGIQSSLIRFYYFCQHLWEDFLPLWQGSACRWCRGICRETRPTHERP